MKKKFTLVLALFVASGMVYDYNYQTVHGDPDGAPSGNTGAPADNNSTCAHSGCHTGPAITNQTATLTSNIPGSGYVPGETYDMTITMSNGGSRFGFGLSPQDQQGNLQGSMIVTESTNTKLTGGSKYLTHKFAGTSGSGTKTWGFQWTAPTAGTGAVTFYGAFNFANNNGGSSGDAILAQSFTFNESSVGITEAELASLTVYPNPVIDEVHVAAKDVDEEIMITMFDVQGRKVIEEHHDGGDIRIDVKAKSLNAGIYFMQIEAGGAKTVKKLLVK